MGTAARGQRRIHATEPPDSHLLLDDRTVLDIHYRPKNQTKLHFLAQMRGELEKLETEKLLQRDEIRALKAEARSYQDELKSLNGRVQGLEEQTLQEAPAVNIGKEVRLRYLERHRQRMEEASVSSAMIASNAVIVLRIVDGLWLMRCSA